MKKILLAALLLSASCVHASDWQPAAINDKVISSVDISSIVKVGPYRKAWFAWTYVEKQFTNDHEKLGYQSAKNLEYFDCITKKSSTIQSIRYDADFGKGNVVKNHRRAFNQADMEDVVPDSFGEVNLNIVCSHRLKPAPGINNSSLTSSNSNGKPRLSADELNARAKGKEPTALTQKQMKSMELPQN